MKSKKFALSCSGAFARAWWFFGAARFKASGLHQMHSQAHMRHRLCSFCGFPHSGWLLQGYCAARGIKPVFFRRLPRMNTTVQRLIRNRIYDRDAYRRSIISSVIALFDVLRLQAHRVVEPLRQTENLNSSNCCKGPRNWS